MMATRSESVLPGEAEIRRGEPVRHVLASALRALTWRHWAWATGLGVLGSVLVAFETLHINFFWLHGRILTTIPWYVAFAWIFLVAIVLAESCTEPGDPVPRRHYFAAAVAASLACIAIVTALGEHFVQAPRREIAGGSDRYGRAYHAKDRRASAVFALGLDGVLHGWLATFVYSHLRNARLAARALAQAQLERTEVRRRLLVARLQAGRSRADPEKVFRALEEIERAYEVDAARADALVAELAEYLRDAIPRFRAEVGQGGETS